MQFVKIGGLILAAGIGLSGAALVAEAGSNLCASNRVCVYVDANFSGLMGTRSPGGALVNVSSLNNDKMSSWENKTGTNAAFYYGVNGTGTCVTMKAGYEHHYVGAGANDQMSSWRTDRGC